MVLGVLLGVYRRRIHAGVINDEDDIKRTRKLGKEKAGTKARKVGDGGGLFLFVTSAGGKLWRWKYRYQGKPRLMALGKYPDVSLAQARERHGQGRKLLATGVDPRRAQRKVDKVYAEQNEMKENSFSTVAAKWLEHWQVGKCVRYADIVGRQLDNDDFCLTLVWVAHRDD